MANGLLVRFRYEPQHMAFESQKQGHPIYQDIEVVEIIPIGDNKTVVVREVTEEDRSRFPDEYKRFKDGVGGHLTKGTPLEQWPFMRPAQIKMLQFYNCFSVEDLAGLSDTSIQAMGPGTRDLVKQAMAYLEKAKDGSAITRIHQENDDLRDQVKLLTQQVTNLLSERKADEADADAKKAKKAA